MKMTYVDPQGNKTVASPVGSSQAPIVNLTPSPITAPTKIAPSVQSQSTVEISSNAVEFAKFIELEVLQTLKLLVEKNATPQERIQDIARLTLELIQPNMTIDGLYRNAVKLDDRYSEMAPVVIKIMRAYEEKYERKALGQVTELIKAKQFDQAQEMVKKVLQFKINS